MKLRPLYVVLGIVVLILLWMWVGYNGLISSKAAVDTSWSNVETTYQRRFDLIPNLVSTVKGAANFEQSTLTQVTNARSAWANAKTTGDRIAAAQTLDAGLSRLLVTVEAYPQLQATQAFRDLMTQLEGTENRITVARRDYNEAVKSYNIRVQRFPTNILAGMFGFAPATLFQSTPGAENAPKVDFGQGVSS
jgi:LemA protein